MKKINVLLAAAFLITHLAGASFAQSANSFTVGATIVSISGGKTEVITDVGERLTLKTQDWFEVEGRICLKGRSDGLHVRLLGITPGECK